MANFTRCNIVSKNNSILDVDNARQLNNIIIRPINHINKPCVKKYTTHVLQKKQMDKLKKYLNKNGFSFNWQEVKPD